MRTCIKCAEPRMGNWAYCPYCGVSTAFRRSDNTAQVTSAYASSRADELASCLAFEGQARRPGVKLDVGKPEVYTGVFQSFPLALQEISRITIEGTKEPGHVLHGWKEVPEGFKRYSEAMGRHLLREALTGDPDEHTFQIATTCWNDLARLEHRLQDRVKAEG